ncbi:unnamed protein product [Prunus armeniaca]
MSTYDHDKLLMFDSESPFEREPNVFDGELLNDRQDTNSEALDLDSAESEDADDGGPDLEVIDERLRLRL